MQSFGDWTPSLRLGIISTPFRSDLFSRALWYSLLSFGLLLAIFYFWLLLVSIINSGETEAGPMQKLVRLHLGWCDRWWWPLKLALPFMALTAFWVGFYPVLSRYNIVPQNASVRNRLEQGATIALASYLSWQYVIYALLLLYVLSSYVYLGSHPVWAFVSVTGKNLLAPLRLLPLRLGKLDFAPMLAIAVIFFAAGFAQRKLMLLYTRLPL